MGAMRRRDDDLGRDVWWALAFVALLFLGAADELFVWLALGLVAALGVKLSIGALRRRRRERANADKPFWLDEIRRPPP